MEKNTPKTDIIKMLKEIIKEEAIETWLETPNPAFDGLKPITLVEEGRSERLITMLYQVRSGAPI
jgi:uncharacterized protein (DUF2384 family)